MYRTFVWHQLTDWMVFDTEKDLNTKADVITDYIKFCMANSIPDRKVKKYPNSRPWMTAQMKLMLREKNRLLNEKTGRHSET